jgi:hypothetical protein
MRTTLTLDDDVTRLVQDEMHRRRTTLKQVVNDAIRRGLCSSRGDAKKYRAPQFSAELASSVDPAGLNRFGDDLEAEAVLSRRHS